MGLLPNRKNSPQILRRYLEVNNKPSNIDCRAELDRLPLLMPLNQKIMKYFVYKKNKGNNKGNESIYKQYNLTSLDAESLDNDKIR